MRTTEAEVRGPNGGRELREALRAEFARLDLEDVELADRLAEYAVAALDAESSPAGELDPEAAARIALAVVAGAQELTAPGPPVAGPTIGELTARQLLAVALRPRRTRGAGA